MKKIVYLLFWLPLLYACTPSSSENKETSEVSEVAPDPKDTTFTYTQPAIGHDAIPMDTANKWIANWKKANPNAPSYFTVPSTDLWEAMGEAKPKKSTHFPNARIFLALDSKNVAHLILTPAWNSGKMHYWNGPYTPAPGMQALRASGDPNGPYMLDFTNPCPPTCPN